MLYNTGLSDSCTIKYVSITELEFLKSLYYNIKFRYLRYISVI